MPATSGPDPALTPPASQAEEDYNRLFNLSLDLLCVAGMDGYFKRVNPSWTRIFGWSEAELLSRPVESFMHPEDRERTLVARSSLAEGVAVRGLENRYLCKDGSYRWLSWQSVLEPSGAMVFAVARDITERRQLDHDRLVISKLESTGILAGGIAHDFNNLLGSLLLTLEMVSMCATTTNEQEQYLRQARQTIQSAKELTQQLITFAEGGASSRRSCDLRVLLKESVDVALKGSALRAEFVVAPDLWPAEVDEAQLAQVFRGLILNAREATPAGGNVRVSAQNIAETSPAPPELPQGDYVRITITDDGMGIPSEILPKIFDPYFSTKQRGVQKGMGLGLTICRTVIQKHGGTITVRSRAGQGTTVTCHPPATRNAVPPTPPSVQSSLGPKPRILVMDDEQSFREILAQTVRHLGYDVEVARNGEEAISLYEQARGEGRPFAVVLLDLTVRGGMGGSKAMAVLQAHDPAVQAVLMTGYSNEETFREHVRHGFKAALAKPFSAGTLRGVLAQILATAPSSPRSSEA